MAKIPFDIKFRSQIESGEYKVETVKGFPVEILKYDAKHKFAPIIFSYIDDTGEYTAQTNGKDLFIVTPEEELTEFEMAIHRRLNLMNGENLLATELLEETKGMAAELLALAREQFIKDGYVIEKKIFHDAVKRVDTEVMKEVSEAIDLSNFEYAMLRYVQEGANVKDDEELIKLTKKYSKELRKILKLL